MRSATRVVSMFLSVLALLVGSTYAQHDKTVQESSERTRESIEDTAKSAAVAERRLDRRKDIELPPQPPPRDVDPGSTGDDPFAIPRIVIHVYGCGDLNAHIVQGPGGRHCVCNSGFAPLGILGCVPQSVVNFFGDRETACEALTCGLTEGGGGGTGGLRQAACGACRARAKGRYDAIRNGLDSCMQALRQQAQRQCAEDFISCGGKDIRGPEYWSDLDLHGASPYRCERGTAPDKSLRCTGPAIRKCIRECAEGVPGRSRGTTHEVGLEAYGLSGGGGMSHTRSYPSTIGFREMCLSAQKQYLLESAEVLSACLGSNRCQAEG